MLRRSASRIILCSYPVLYTGIQVSCLNTYLWVKISEEFIHEDGVEEAVQLDRHVDTLFLRQWSQHFHRFGNLIIDIAEVDIGNNCMQLISKVTSSTVSLSNENGYVIVVVHHWTMSKSGDKAEGCNFHCCQL